MNIAVDARELAGRTTGVGRYLRGLVDAWVQDPDAARHDWTFYAHEPIAVPLGRAHQLRGSGGTWWEQRTLASAIRREPPHVLFAPAYTAPLTVNVPRVLTIHDLSYFAHPEWFRAREGARRRFVTARSAAAAAAILTVSEFSKREIAERLNIPPERIHVVYHGITPRAPGPDQREPIVLFVGSIFNRRHVPDLVRGFARLARAHDGVRLEIVGDDRAYPPEPIEEAARLEDVGDRVRVRSYVDEATLNDLYARARTFAFLSEYEGFGFTPLEALSAGVPPLLFDTAVARETCGAAADYVATTDPAAVAGALERTLFDRDARARILGAAPAVLARYRWDAAARATLRLLERAAS